MIESLLASEEDVNWGGPREGSGRKKKEGGRKEPLSVRVSRDVLERFESYLAAHPEAKKPDLVEDILEDWLRRNWPAG
jgi:hypothetical protein